MGLTVLPKFDPWADAGQQLGGGIGQGIGQGLQLLGQRQMGLKALEQLSQIDQDQFSKMSMPQKLAMLQAPFAGLPGFAQAGADITGTALKESERLAGAKTRDVINEANLRDRGDKPLTSPKGPKAEGASEYDKVKIAPDLPNNMSIETQKALSLFPNFRGRALQGDPQGLSFDERESVIEGLIKLQRTREQAERQADALSDYIKGQYGFRQGLQNDVSNAAQEKYGNSPWLNEIERSMMKKSDDLIAAGEVEPNALINAARSKGKQIEGVINSAKSVEGRPYFDFDLESRKSKTGSLLMPLIKDGEVQMATKLAMARVLGTDENGQTIYGPDWGAVRAAEIVQERANPVGFKNLRQFVNTLPDLGGTSVLNAGPAQKARLARQRPQALDAMVSYLSDPKKFTEADSLALFRGWAKDAKGIDEDLFGEAVKIANEKRAFSDYQKMEQAEILSTNITPSLTEMLNGKKNVSDWFTGKK